MQTKKIGVIDSNVYSLRRFSLRLGYVFVWHCHVMGVGESGKRKPRRVGIFDFLFLNFFATKIRDFFLSPLSHSISLASLLLSHSISLFGW